MSEEYLKKYPEGIGKLFVIGYILRIIPVANIIGVGLTAIGYLRLGSKWIRDKMIMVGSIGSIIILVGIIINIYYGLLIPLLSTPSAQGQTSTVAVYVKYINEMIEQLTRWYSLLPPIIIGIGLLLESGALNNIRRYIGNAMPRYIIVLLVIFGIVQLSEPAAIFATIPMLRDFRNDLVNGVISDPATMAIRMLSAMLPLLIVSVLSFIIMLLAYILIAYRFHKLSKIAREVALIKSVEEGGGGEEEIVI